LKALISSTWTLQRPPVDPAVEQTPGVLFAAPERRRLCAGRRRCSERPHRPEERAEHAVRRPAEEPDRAAGAAHPDELVGHRLVERREHDADRGHDDVEGLVAERQMLGVCFDPLEVEPGGLGLLATGFEQLRRQVGSRDLRAARSAAGSAAFPVPAATSSTLIPGPIPQASTSRGPIGRRNVSTIDG
jgi:hypothetical protein